MGGYAKGFGQLGADNIRHAHLFSGADAGAKIAAAAADLPTAGGIVDARGFEGAQSIATAIVFSKPTILLLGDATFTYTGTVTAFQLSSGCFIVGSHQLTSIIHVTGLTSDGITPGNDSGVMDVTVRGPNSAASGYSGIDGAATGVFVHRTIVEKWGSHGINTGASSARWIISECTVRQNLVDDGILIGRGATDCKVLDCFVYSNGAWGIDCNGSRCMFRGNHVFSNGSVGGSDNGGILVYGYSSYNADKNQVIGNHSYSNYGPGILVSAGTGATANRNVVTGNQCHGNLAAVISGNGIMVGADEGTFSFNIVHDNHCGANARAGVEVHPGSAGTASKNSVCNNTCDTNAYGVIVNTGVVDTLLYDNIFLSNTSQDIYEFGTRTRRRGNINSVSDALTAEGGTVRVTTQFDKTTSTVLADVTGLSVTVYQQKKYRFRAVLFVDASVAGGGKYAIACALTATNIKYQILAIDNATLAYVITARHAALLGTTGQNGAAALLVVIEGEILTAAGAEAGALTVRIAQNVSSGTSSVLVNSTLTVEQIPA